MKVFLAVILSLIITVFPCPDDFLSDQKKHERVRIAFREKGQLVIEILKKNEIPVSELNILIVVYKEERNLELFAKKTGEISFKKIVAYDICSSSGQPGPKRCQGDKQVPEGFYFIDGFNPESAFFLSLKISYPNMSDKIRSIEKNLGGDIFIHGSCVTVGCIPVTDEKIKELYLYAIQARQNGQMKIPVYIFPFKMTDQKMKEYRSRYMDNPDLLKFWDSLKTGYDKFEKGGAALEVTIDSYGNYLF